MHGPGTPGAALPGGPPPVHRAMQAPPAPSVARPDASLAVHRTMHARLSASLDDVTVGATVDKRSRRARMARLGALVAGIRKWLGKMPTVTVASVDYTPAELAQLFQDELDSITDVQAAESARKAARLRERRTWKKNRLTHRVFEGIVRGFFSDARTLGDFGFDPAKKGEKTIAVKAEAAAKARATRASGGRPKKKAK